MTARARTFVCNSAALVTLSVAATLACSGPPAKAPEAPQHAGPQHWYPLDAGNVWSFSIREVKGGPAILVVTKVIAFDGTLALLQTGSAETSLRVTADSIAREPSGSVLLRTPLRLGDKWAGATGSQVEVTRLDAAVTTDAGAFKGCVEITETFAGDDARTMHTTFCPEVGPVLVDVRPIGLPIDGTPQGEIGKLRSFSPATPAAGAR